MTKEQIECFNNRLELVVRNLRPCNSGAEVHEVANMRTFAELLIHKLKSGETDFEKFDHDVCKLEAKTVDFFKKKFQNLK